MFSLTKFLFPPATLRTVGFEDILHAIKNPHNCLVINTLHTTEQYCLILSTLAIHLEEKRINELIDNYETKKVHILVYGRNSQDITAETKCKQLLALGFSNVYLYTSGLFEWCLLQDIYGYKAFPTTNTIDDILRFKPAKMIDIPALH
jgi:hypothetical protein